MRRRCRKRRGDISSDQINASSDDKPSDGKSDTLKVVAILLWSLLPCAAMWIGLYVMNSAIWAYGLYHFVCLVPALIVGRSIWTPGLKRPSLKFCSIILALAIVFAGITVGAYEIAGKIVLSDQAALALMNKVGWSKANLWTLNIYAIIVNPFVEEFYWRGLVLNILDKVKNPPFPNFGIICSSLLYALFHYFIFRLVLFPFAAEIGSLMLAVYGGMLAVIYRRTGSIVAAGVAHGLLTDLAAVMLIADLMRKFPGVL